MVYEDFRMLTLKRLSGDPLQVLAVSLLSTLLSIASYTCKIQGN